MGTVNLNVHDNKSLPLRVGFFDADGKHQWHDMVYLPM